MARRHYELDYDNGEQATNSPTLLAEKDHALILDKLCRADDIVTAQLTKLKEASNQSSPVDEQSYHSIPQTQMTITLDSTEDDTGAYSVQDKSNLAFLQLHASRASGQGAAFGSHIKIGSIKLASHPGLVEQVSLKKPCNVDPCAQESRQDVTKTSVSSQKNTKSGDQFDGADCALPGFGMAMVRQLFDSLDIDRSGFVLVSSVISHLKDFPLIPNDWNEQKLVQSFHELGIDLKDFLTFEDYSSWFKKYTSDYQSSNDANTISPKNSPCKTDIKAGTPGKNLMSDSKCMINLEKDEASGKDTQISRTSAPLQASADMDSPSPQTIESTITRRTPLTKRASLTPKASVCRLNTDPLNSSRRHNVEDDNTQSAIVVQKKQSGLIDWLDSTIQGRESKPMKSTKARNRVLRESQIKTLFKRMSQEMTGSSVTSPESIESIQSMKRSQLRQDSMTFVPLRRIRKKPFSNAPVPEPEEVSSVSVRLPNQVSTDIDLNDWYVSRVPNLRLGEDRRLTLSQNTISGVSNGRGSPSVGNSIPTMKNVSPSRCKARLSFVGGSEVELMQSPLRRSRHKRQSRLSLTMNIDPRTNVVAGYEIPLATHTDQLPALDQAIIQNELKTKYSNKTKIRPIIDLSLYKTETDKVDTPTSMVLADESMHESGANFDFGLSTTKIDPNSTSPFLSEAEGVAYRRGGSTFRRSFPPSRSRSAPFLKDKSTSALQSKQPQTTKAIQYSNEYLEKQSTLLKLSQMLTVGVTRIPTEYRKMLLKELGIASGRLPTNALQPDPFPRLLALGKPAVIGANRIGHILSPEARQALEAAELEKKLKEEEAKARQEAHIKARRRASNVQKNSSISPSAPALAPGTKEREVKTTQYISEAINFNPEIICSSSSAKELLHRHEQEVARENERLTKRRASLVEKEHSLFAQKRQLLNDIRKSARRHPQLVSKLQDGFEGKACITGSSKFRFTDLWSALDEKQTLKIDKYLHAKVRDDSWPKQPVPIEHEHNSRVSDDKGKKIPTPTSRIPPRKVAVPSRQVKQSRLMGGQATKLSSIDTEHRFGLPPVCSISNTFTDPPPGHRSVVLGRHCPQYGPYSKSSTQEKRASPVGYSYISPSKRIRKKTRTDSLNKHVNCDKDNNDVVPRQSNNSIPEVLQAKSTSRRPLHPPSSLTDSVYAPNIALKRLDNVHFHQGDAALYFPPWPRSPLKYKHTAGGYVTAKERYKRERIRLLPRDRQALQKNQHDWVALTSLPPEHINTSRYNPVTPTLLRPISSDEPLPKADPYHGLEHVVDFLTNVRKMQEAHQSQDIPAGQVHAPTQGIKSDAAKPSNVGEDIKAREQSVEISIPPHVLTAAALFPQFARPVQNQSQSYLDRAASYSHLPKKGSRGDQPHAIRSSKQNLEEYMKDSIRHKTLTKDLSKIIDLQTDTIEHAKQVYPWIEYGVKAVSDAIRAAGFIHPTSELCQEKDEILWR